MYWINGLYTYCSLNKVLWCSDTLVSRGADAEELKALLTDDDSSWLPCPRKPPMEGKRMGNQWAELKADQRRIGFQDKRWSLPATDRYDRPRDEELLGEDEE